MITSSLNADSSLEVIGSAPDPIFALDKMSRRWPDVIVLDVEMPRMDGITFLRKIMAERPTPVVICSSLTSKGADTAVEALAAGAVEVVAKPDIGLRRQMMEQVASELIRTVKAAASASLRRTLPRNASVTIEPKLSADAILPPAGKALFETTERIVAIGTSTGGTQALEVVLSGLPRTVPGVVVVQHMPERFTASFALRLDGLCQINVREARSGDRVVAGLALIAPGGRHLLLRRSGAQYYVDVVDGPPVNRHRPSVDVLFRSVARHAGRNALGIIMTGMGDDGARGLLEMRHNGATTLAQDEASCVVFGMPREAIKLDAADRVVSLDAIAGEICGFHDRRRSNRC